MECSGLVNFPFSVEEALRLHSETKEEEEEEEESKSGGAGAAGPPAGDGEGGDSSDGSSDDGSDFSDSDSDFDPEDLGQDLPPLHPLPLANPINNNNNHNNNQPAARARQQRRVVLIADIDDFGNIFLTALDASVASSSSTAAAASASSFSSAAASSSSSSSSSAAAAAAAGSLSPSDRHERALAQALEHELNLASAGGESGPAAAPPGAKKARRGPASAKAAFRDSLEFLRVQKGFDQSLQSDRALLNNQRRTMRLHESLRTIFKIVIFASMVWSTRQLGVVHLVARYATWIYLARDVAALMGFEIHFDVEVNQHPLQHHQHHLHAPQQQQQQGAHGPGHGHGHAHGGEGAGLDGDLIALQPLPPQALMQPLQPVLDFFGMWGGGPALHPLANMPLQLPHAAAAVAAAAADGVAPAPVDVVQLRRRQCIRRVALLAVTISLVEVYNALTGSSDPAWFTSMQLTWLRFLPLQFLAFLASLLALGGASWRSRWVQLGLVGALLLEGFYWHADFRSKTMTAFAHWMVDSLAPKVGRLLSIAARVTPVAAVASSVLWTLSQALMVLLPIVADAAVEQQQPPPQQQQQLNANANALQAQGMPIVNLNPNAQNFPLIFAVLRHNPQLRRCYRTVLYSVLAAVALECLFSYFGFQLPIVADSWRRLQVVGPVLASLLYEVVVFEGRGVLIGLALLRFVYVVDQSLPIHTLTILAPPHATNVSSPQLRPAESVPLDPSSTALARQGSSSSSSSASASPPVPAVVCLSCARHRTPFMLVRLLQDLIFETHLLVSFLNSGVQALLIQRQEQTLQLIDTNVTIQLAIDQQRRQRSSAQGADADANSNEQEAKYENADEDEDTPEPHVQVQTCPDCVLHSIHMQLLLPFVYLCASYFLFSRLLPPPPYSTYREIILSTLHYIFDRVPLLVLLDLFMGWWNGRVLQWRKIYLSLSTLILAYAFYVVFFSWFHSIGIWWLMPGTT